MCRSLSSATSMSVRPITSNPLSYLYGRSLYLSGVFRQGLFCCDFPFVYYSVGSKLVHFSTLSFMFIFVSVLYLGLLYMCASLSSVSMRICVSVAPSPRVSSSSNVSSSSSVSLHLFLISPFYLVFLLSVVLSVMYMRLRVCVLLHPFICRLLAICLFLFLSLPSFLRNPFFSPGILAFCICLSFICVSGCVCCSLPSQTVSSSTSLRCSLIPSLCMVFLLSVSLSVISMRLRVTALLHPFACHPLTGCLLLGLHAFPVFPSPCRGIPCPAASCRVLVPLRACVSTPGLMDATPGKVPRAGGRRGTGTGTNDVTECLAGEFGWESNVVLAAV